MLSELPIEEGKGISKETTLFLIITLSIIRSPCPRICRSQKEKDKQGKGSLPKA